MCGTSTDLFFFNDTATTEIYTLSLHDALPISLDHFWQGKDVAHFLVEPLDDCLGHAGRAGQAEPGDRDEDRKSTRLNSSHANISYAVFCLTKKRLAELWTLNPSLVRQSY